MQSSPQSPQLEKSPQATKAQHGQAEVKQAAATNSQDCEL